MQELQVIPGGAVAARQRIGAEMLQSFISYLDATPKTIETYTRNLKQLFTYFAVNGITQPSREDIIAYREALKDTGHKPATIQGYITAAKLFFKWTAQEGIYPNIADRLKGAKLDGEHKKEPFTPYQVKDILASIETTTLKGKRDYAILWLMVTGGLRTIEVIRADIEDFRVNGANTVIYVQGKGRTEKTEYVKIPAPAEKAIREYLAARGKTAEDSPLFTSLSNNNREQRLTTRSISRLVKDTLMQAGYNSSRWTAHSLRHTAITLSFQEGKGDREVQQFARHRNIATTLIYDHSLEKAKNSCSDAVARAILDA